MSTVLEADAAHGAGMEVVAVSCITNPAAGISTKVLNHQEVVQAGPRQLVPLLR
jgi:Purine nucleoside phosphorylase